MDCAEDKLYPRLERYLRSLEIDSKTSGRIIHVVMKARISVHTFIGAIALYKQLLRCIQQSNSRPIYTKTDDLKSIYIKSTIHHQPQINCLNGQKINLSFKSSFGNSTNSKKLSSLILSILNNHYLIIVVCCVIACKVYTDMHFTNESWCSVIHISFLELNRIERELLGVLDYKVGFDGFCEVKDEMEALVRSEEPSANLNRTPSYVKPEKGLVKKYFCLF